ncbi:SDR family NAD(P)-dependent oxidoreductase [Dactylosporangium sp. AC04546]|uniref:SDR family NAD(P)-dependent oxidoreductase n=1 Tax=Dactylosporangium sp. AC04546 TaxID=2862460 RepID=UPI001EDF6CC8|nr:SDR family NAD(P)-dependent oxidoreductase [Dactylosporangium sp. AC04546]WVK87375.1 SDR family NAD(P)-dependent oxidoreductase [Dactylosporangium sp. AC04546]
MTLNGKVALVTGSSRGIGTAIATTFAAAGAQVVLHGRDTSALAEVQARIGAASVVTGDVTVAADLARMRDEIVSRHGRLDILVANAGSTTSRPAPIEDITEESWRADIDRNLTGTFLTVKTFLPLMKAQRSGTIITLSSAAGRKPSDRTIVAYAAAKAGVQLFTQDLAAQVGPFGIRANCLAPETILTETNQQWIPSEVQRSMAEAHPLRRLGTPEDVARAALFLASDDSSWITGVIVDVAGGAVLA